MLPFSLSSLSDSFFPRLYKESVFLIGLLFLGISGREGGGKRETGKEEPFLTNRTNWITSLIC